jgi:ubiquinone/menaquinone biosynthesis C-methylase UbiE
MPTPDLDRRFAGSIPQLYEQYLVPLIFEPYPRDLARRVARRQPSSVLEIAAGTGAVTRQLAAALPPSTAIVASDLNEAMLAQAAAMGTSRPVEWRQADAMRLPFADASFDVVACQFGAMFFPDKPAAYAEARRVLRPGGCFVFSVWDAIEHNEFADVVTSALEAVFPEDPPRFLARTPHGYNDCELIARQLREAGFASDPDVTTLAARSRAADAHVVAFAYCQGTPLRNEIEARDPSGVDRATDVATRALASRFGSGELDAKIQAHLLAVERS